MSADPPDFVGLRELRVVDLSTGIAGAYATKLFADAGAEVIKVEPDDGDPLRRWSIGGLGHGQADGALFRFLHHGKQSVSFPLGDPRIELLLASADIIVDNSVPPSVDPAELRRLHPRLVFVSVTPYGLTGPLSGRPATEFTVQAESGGIATRGLRDRPPIMAGGRVGDWVAGAFAAAAASIASWNARGTGVGDHLDLSMCEVHNIASSLFLDLKYQLMGRSLDGLGPPRTLETPSIEPTKDGWVGFNTNSRQQFDDFLVLIDRLDLLGDDELAKVSVRMAKIDEWRAVVRAWTTQRTTDEIVEKASALRIPVAPIGNGALIRDFPHFCDRDVFEFDPTKSFHMPRRPWTLNNHPAPPAACAPEAGEHTETVNLSRAVPPHLSDRRQVSQLRVLDLTAWFAGPACANVFASFGADVIHVESTTRLDGMRLAGGSFNRDRWWERSPVFLTANTNKRGITLDLSRAEGRDILLRLVEQADVIIENFTPRVLENLDIGWETIHRVNPKAILARMPAFGLTGPWRNNPGFAQTMEQLTGLAWVTGYPDEQPVIQTGPCDPNAGMHAVFAIVVALAERERTGVGQLLEVPMVETALNIAAEQTLEYSAYGTLQERDGNRSPYAAPQNLYACQGEENWLALAVETDGQWVGLCAAVGRPDWAEDPALVDRHGRRRAHDRLDEGLAEWASVNDIDEAIAVLAANGVPAGKVFDTRITHLHPQFSARGFYETVDHPVVGEPSITGLPFRSCHVDRWIREPAPTLGQHNRAALSELLKLSDVELDDLESAGVIGSWPEGL